MICTNKHECIIHNTQVLGEKGSHNFGALLVERTLVQMRPKHLEKWQKQTVARIDSIA